MNILNFSGLSHMKKIFLFFPFWWVFPHGGYDNISPIADIFQAESQLIIKNAQKNAINENARTQKIRNDAERIRTRWKIQDEFQARKPSYLDKAQKRLDNMEKNHNLKQREKELIAKGAIKPPNESRISWKGRSWVSIEHFKRSDDYLAFKTEVADRKHRDKIEEEQNLKEIQELIRQAHEKTPGYLLKKSKEEVDKIIEKLEK